MINVFAAVGALAVILPVLIVIGVLASVWKAWWFYPTWAWFIVPLGAPAIGFWHFTALLFLFNTLTAHVEVRKDARPVEWAGYLTIFLWPIVAWAILRWMHGA